MTRDDIIRMAREAHMHHMAWDDDYIEGTERFAALVAAHERNRKWTQAHWTEYERSIAAAEREACAKIADDEANDAMTAGEHNPKSNAAWNISMTAKRISDAIRAIPPRHDADMFWLAVAGQGTDLRLLQLLPKAA
jgi:hypothetical protein